MCARWLIVASNDSITNHISTVWLVCVAWQLQFLAIFTTNVSYVMVFKNIVTRKIDEYTHSFLKRGIPLSKNNNDKNIRYSVLCPIKLRQSQLFFPYSRYAHIILIFVLFFCQFHVLSLLYLPTEWYTVCPRIIQSVCGPNRIHQPILIIRRDDACGK